MVMLFPKNLTPLILGIDLGGTKSAAVIGTESGEILLRVAGATPAQAGPDAIIPLLIALSQQALKQWEEQAAGNAPRRVVGVGVSAGAPADAVRGRIFEAPNLPGWGADGVPLAEILGDALGLPVALENDADATALAEHRFGAGQGTTNMIFLTVGTGIGAGLILDGRLHRGERGAGGEVGHIRVGCDNELCDCGLRNCLEAYASGPSLVRHAIRRGYAGAPTGQAVFAAARAGDPAALGAVQVAGQMLGRGIAALAMLLNPQRIVLGTLAVHGGDLLLPYITESVRENCWARNHESLSIVPAALGDRAQDLAAVCAWLHQHES